MNMMQSQRLHSHTVFYLLYTVDTLYSFGQIDHHVPHEKRTWVISAHVGGLGFSLLATVPFLKHLSITSHTHHTRPAHYVYHVWVGTNVVGVPTNQVWPVS